MNRYRPEELILTRLLRELHQAQTIGLSSGIPQLVKPHLADRQLVELNSSTNISPLDVVVVDPLEVSHRGDLSLPTGVEWQRIQSARWIVATRHHHASGETKLVSRPSRPVDCTGCARLIVTEMGVIQISDVGFVLRELAPGLSSDDVRSAIRASLHVADDLQLMALD